MPLVPVFAWLGAGLLSYRRIRATLLVLLAPQLLIAAVGWQHPRFLWPLGDGRNRVLDYVLGWAGGSASFLPSLRVPEAGFMPALVIVAAVAALNVWLWQATGRDRGEPPWNRRATEG